MVFLNLVMNMEININSLIPIEQTLNGTESVFKIVDVINRQSQLEKITST